MLSAFAYFLIHLVSVIELFNGSGFSFICLFLSKVSCLASVVFSPTLVENICCRIMVNATCFCNIYLFSVLPLSVSIIEMHANTHTHTHTHTHHRHHHHYHHHFLVYLKALELAIVCHRSSSDDDRIRACVCVCVCMCVCVDRREGRVEGPSGHSGHSLAVDDASCPWGGFEYLLSPPWSSGWR